MASRLSPEFVIAVISPIVSTVETIYTNIIAIIASIWNANPSLNGTGTDKSGACDKEEKSIFPIGIANYVTNH